MTSRMSKYHQKEERSAKNEELYSKLQDMGTYSNIEGVVTIDTTNEIDITKVKAMMQNRENYQKKKQYNDLVGEEEETYREAAEEYDETKNYDIRDILDKAKEDYIETDTEYRKIRPVKLDVLEKLKEKAETPEEEEEIQELIDTITIQTELIEKTMGGQEDIGLLDDLKSHTMVGDPASIKKIIEEAKEEEDFKEEEQKEPDIDKSFYSSSFKFKKSDFTGIEDDDEDDEPSSKKILKILLIIAAPILILIVSFLLIG